MTDRESSNPIDDGASPQEAEAQARRRISRRRMLLAAGWTVPVVLALNLPVKAFAQVSQHLDCNITPTDPRCQET